MKLPPWLDNHLRRGEQAAYVRLAMPCHELPTDWTADLLFVAQLFELGPDGGDHETDGELLAETDVLAYDCAAR